MYWMKYGFSRSLNCNSETDLASSSLMARITGSVASEESWPREIGPRAKNKQTQNADFQQIERFTSALRFEQSGAEGWEDDPRISPSFALQSALSEWRATQLQQVRTRIRHRRTR